MIEIVVTGTPRSGTSMTMQILKRMGCDVAGEKMPSKNREAFARDRAVYLNPHGFLEESKVVMRGAEDPSVYTGKTLKIMFPGLGMTPMSGVKHIILCLRDPREIAYSQRMLVTQASVIDNDGNRRYAGEMTKVKQDNYVRAMGQFCKWAYQNDVFWGKTHIVNYADVIDNAEATVKRLCSFVGKPFVKDAAAAVDASLYRSIPGDSVHGFDLALLIYRSLLNRSVSAGLIKEIDEAFRINRMESVSWVGEWGYPVNPGMYRALKSKNTGLVKKMDVKFSGADFKKCEYYSESDIEFYEIKRPPDLGTLRRPMVLCRKTTAFKTIEACFLCRKGN